MKQVQTAVNEIMQYIRQENAALRDRVAHLESRVALLESQNSISPAKPASKADTIRNMLAAEPDLTAVEIQRRTGIKGGTIRDIMSQVRRSQPS